MTGESHSKNAMKRTVALLLVVAFLNGMVMPSAWGYSMSSEFLCEIGIRFYQQGRYDDALLEFRKALMIVPDHELALRYIRLIEDRKTNLKIDQTKALPFLGGLAGEATPVEPQALKDAAVSQPLSPLAAEALPPRVSGGTAISIQEPSVPVGKAAAAKKVGGPSSIAIQEASVSSAEAIPAQVIKLDPSFGQIVQPINIEQGRRIIISGNGIKRFLVVDPKVIHAEQQGPDDLEVTGKDLGYTYMHVWDNNERWTIEFLTVMPEPEGPTYEEALRQQEESARTFKLVYDLGWSSYETGRRFDSSMARSSYSWSHRFNLSGETPYGDFNSQALVRSLRTTTDLTYATVSLTKGKLGPFKDFTLQGLDISAPFTNLMAPDVGLRGASLSSPAFNNKIQYAAFWGREGGGRFGGLSPGLSKVRNAFVNGINLKYMPVKKQNYNLSILHGWGRDRYDYLSRYGYDLSGEAEFARWGFDYDLGYDSDRFGMLLGTELAKSERFKLSTEFRNVSKNFTSITGRGWRAGELGGLMSMSYQINDNWDTTAMLDAYVDRYFPGDDEDDRWNETYRWTTDYRIDDYTSVGASYDLQNRLGGISQTRYQSTGVKLSKTFKWKRNISTYMNFFHQENENYSSPGSSYLNERFYAGLRFSLIGALRYYFSREMNWLDERYNGVNSRPNAYEMGLDWTDQFGDSPWHGSFRLTFRDEEDTDSALSFLSGEDSLEGFAELSWKPAPEREIFGSMNVRHIWADKESVSKRVEANFNMGMRYFWDTGVAWESVGNIEGYVFKDMNSDGLRQRDEAPVEGVKLWVGKDKFAVTDMFGYYKFSKIKARKAFVTADSTTFPPGFVVTVPISQEVSIAHHRTSGVDFGIVSRSEISGLVFEDTDGDGRYGRMDKGVQGVLITLEDGSRCFTDGVGRFAFPHASVGTHTITLELETLPMYYLPQTPLKADIVLSEGVSFIHNIPLKRIEDN